MLDRNREQEQDVEKKKGVLLITLHAAKGLEFTHVFLVGLEEGVLPHDRSKVEGTLDEERRLLYVGITRAMRTLTMTYCRDRMKYGSASPCHPSSFIKELADEKRPRLRMGSPGCGSCWAGNQGADAILEPELEPASFHPGHCFSVFCLIFPMQSSANSFCSGEISGESSAF
jgi:hypothetical protein